MTGMGKPPSMGNPHPDPAFIQLMMGTEIGRILGDGDGDKKAYPDLTPLHPYLCHRT